MIPEARLDRPMVAWLLVSFLNEIARFLWTWIDLVDAGMAMEASHRHQLAQVTLDILFLPMFYPVYCP